MPLDPQARAYLARVASARIPPVSELSVTDARRVVLALARMSPEPVPIHAIEDRVVSGPDGNVRIRIYRPGIADNPGVLVYLHGGGWVTGSIETHDATCRRLSTNAECLVVGVDYRLAPEHPFPAGLRDCFAVTQWVSEHAGEIGAKPGRIAIGGDSAGGNLAAAVTLLARERGAPPLSFQLLVYPAVDHPDARKPSHDANADGYVFTYRDLVWYWRQYLPAPDRADDPLACPLRATDLGGLPPALVITAEYDPIRDEGEMYAARLREAGVATELARFDGMIHGFFDLPHVMTQGAAAHALAARALRTAFAS